MNPEEVLLKCVLCPGLCSYRCPVYSTTSLRASQPVNIARALYLWTYSNEDIYLDNLGYCSLCDKCQSTCPDKNPLPNVIRSLRNKLVKTEKTFHFKEEEYTIYVPHVESDVIKIDGKLYRLSPTHDYYLSISYGFSDRETLSKSYNEDPDCFRNNYSIELLYRYNYKADLDDYVLHIPCKLDEKYVEQFRKVFGKEKSILKICLGGGGIDLIQPKILSRIRDRLKISDSILITQCGWAAKRMREWGLEAYTPLEVIQHE